MKKIIIYGITDLSEFITHFIKRDNAAEIIAYTVEKNYLTTELFLNKPVIAFEEIEHSYSPKEYELFIAIGPTNMNKFREKYFLLAKQKGYTLFTYISSFALVGSPLGENNFVGDFTTINPKVSVGNNNIIYEHCVLAAHASLGNHGYIAPRAIIGSHAKVKDNTIIGMNSVINTEVMVENESLIGAQCYVSSNTEFKGVYGIKSTPLIACISEKVSIKLI